MFGICMDILFTVMLTFFDLAASTSASETELVSEMVMHLVERLPAGEEVGIVSDMPQVGKLAENLADKGGWEIV